MIKKITSSFFKKYHSSDIFLLIIIFSLLVIGVLMIASASVVIGKIQFNDSLFFLKKHLIVVAIGILIFLTAQKIDYHILRRWAPPLMLLGTILLILVFVPGISLTLGGASRWISIGGLTIQPSEFLKLIFIIYLACWLEKKGKGLRDISYGFLPFLIMTGFLAFLIMKQPDMGTMFILTLTSGIIFFVAGASIIHIGVGFGAAFLIFWEFIKTASYRMARLMVFLNPSDDVKGAAYHINQALLAIGSGGLWGRGFNESRQKYFYLPQPISDSIFAITGEELGFIKSAAIIILFVLLAWRGLRIAKYAPDIFGRLLAVGIVSWISFQALINIGTMLAVIPLTGIPLPLISYGGSAFVTSMAGLGILINISKQTTRKSL